MKRIEDDYRKTHPGWVDEQEEMSHSIMLARSRRSSEEEEKEEKEEEEEEEEEDYSADDDDDDDDDDDYDYAEFSKNQQKEEKKALKESQKEELKRHWREIGAAFRKKYAEELEAKKPLPKLATHWSRYFEYGFYILNPLAILISQLGGNKYLKELEEGVFTGLDTQLKANETRRGTKTLNTFRDIALVFLGQDIPGRKGKRGRRPRMRMMRMKYRGKRSTNNPKRHNVSKKTNIFH